MPTIEERLRDTGRVWRDHVDSMATIGEHSKRAPARGRAPKRRVVLIAAAAVVVAAAVPVAGVLAHRGAQGGGGGGIGASCAGPQLRLAGEPAHSRTPDVRVGQELTVTGHFFLDSCNDTNPQLHPAPRPLRVGISLRGHGRTVLLRTVQAHGELGTFRATVRIPAGYPVGTARLTTRTAGPQAKVAEGLPSEPIRLTIVK